MPPLLFFIKVHPLDVSATKLELIQLQTNIHKFLVYFYEGEVEGGGMSLSPISNVVSIHITSSKIITS